MSDDKATRTTIYLPADLAKRARRFKGRLSVSDVARDALEREVARLEEAERADAFDRGLLAAMKLFRDAPLLSGENLDIPPDVANKLAKEPPHVQEGFRAGWHDAVATLAARSV